MLLYLYFISKTCLDNIYITILRPGIFHKMYFSFIFTNIDTFFNLSRIYLIFFKKNVLFYKDIIKFSNNLKSNLKIIIKHVKYHNSYQTKNYYFRYSKEMFKKFNILR